MAENSLVSSKKSQEKTVAGGSTKTPVGDTSSSSRAAQQKTVGAAAPYAPLSEVEAKAASDKNKALKMDKVHWEQIQSIVGVSPDGDPGKKTANGIHKWQHSNGETPTGVFEGKLKTQFGQRFSMMGMKLDGLLERGEGNYKSYNAGTKGTDNGKVKHGGENDFSKMTINEIIANSESKTGNDKDRYFAVGRYQIITSTLKAAKSKLGLSGEQLLTNELQDYIYEAFLMPAKARAYIYGTSNDIVAAQNALAAVWRSIEYGETGKTYPDSASKANKSSITRVEIHAALNEARAKFAAYKSGTAASSAKNTGNAAQASEKTPVAVLIESSGGKMAEGKSAAATQQPSASQAPKTEDKAAPQEAKKATSLFDIARAVSVSNKLGYAPERWGSIQKFVKASVTLSPNNETAEKVYSWQSGYADLENDGIPGTKTWAKMQPLVAKTEAGAAHKTDIEPAASNETPQPKAEQSQTVSQPVASDVAAKPPVENAAPKVAPEQSAAAPAAQDEDYKGIENISRKSTNKSAIKTMQKYLNHYGFNVGTVDGGFGQNTMLQLMYYQYTRDMRSGNAINVDGECGSGTWGAFRTNKAAVYALNSETTFNHGVPTPVEVSAVSSGGKLRSIAATEFNKLYVKASEAGYTLKTNTSIRGMTLAATNSLSGQSDNGQIEFYRNYIFGTGNLAAKPGYSNHQSGISIDLADCSGGTTNLYKWLVANAGTYGFANDGKNFKQVEHWHWTYMALKK